MFLTRYLDKPVMLASTVSSKMLSKIAEKEGFLFEETLTGFKWLGNRATELEEKGHTVLFAFEEAIGFMIGDIVKGGGRMYSFYIHNFM